MNIQQINLPSVYPAIKDYGQATLTCYLPDNSTALQISARPAMLVIPGGGYAFVSNRESEPIALAFTALGYNAFILEYSTAPEFGYPSQLIQVLAALKYIKDNSAQLAVNTGNIAVTGFSAGGHLAACAATLYNNPLALSALNAQADDLRPDAAVLCYPVISSGVNAHRPSFERLTADRPDKEELTDYLSLERQVNANTPPCFLWHTADDTAVPVQNSLLFAAALADNKVPFETHIYKSGPHGLSLSSPVTAVGKPTLINPRIAGWLNLAAEWLSSLGFNIVNG